MLCDVNTKADVGMFSSAFIIESNQKEGLAIKTTKDHYVRLFTQIVRRSFSKLTEQSRPLNGRYALFSTAASTPKQNRSIPVVISHENDEELSR